MPILQLAVQENRRIGNYHFLEFERFGFFSFPKAAVAAGEPYVDWTEKEEAIIF